MIRSRILLSLTLLTAACSQSRYDFEPLSRSIISCDGSPIHSVSISDDSNSLYTVTFDETSGDTAQNAITLLGPKQIGYRSTFPGFQPKKRYQITIGGGDAPGYMIVETDSVGKIANVDNHTPCQ